MSNTCPDRWLVKLACTVLAAGWTSGQLLAAPAVNARPVLSEGLDQDGQRQMARRMLDAGSPLLAASLYRGLLPRAPGDMGLRLEYAQALAAAGRLDEAMAQFTQLLASAPQAAPATAGLMRLHLELDSPAKAIEAFEALPAPQHSASLLLLHGIALDRLQKHAQAQASYRAGLQLDDRSIGLRNNLALSLALTGQLPQAEALLKVLAASSDATPKIRQNLAFVYGLMGKAELAASVAAMDLAPSEVANNRRFFEQLKP